MTNVDFIRFAAALALAGVLALQASSASESGGRFKDPLDTPALASSRAASTQLMAITRAGERLVAVGWRGHIVYSDDGGQQWTQAQVPVGVDLTALHFATPQLGLAVGHGGVILRSADAGKTWTRQTDGRSAPLLVKKAYGAAAAQGDPVASRQIEDAKLNWQHGPEQPWADVLFLDAQHAYAVGTFNLIFETRDAGLNWKPVSEQVDNPDGFHLNAISSIDGRVYIASEKGRLFVRQPQGSRFGRVETGYSGSFFGVCRTSRGIAAYGLRGTVMHSKDGLGNWQKLETGVDAAITGCAWQGGRSVLVTQGGEVLIESADGRAYQRSPASARLPLFGVAASGAHGLVSVGLAGASRLELNYN